jgi:hypothetical protein
MYIDKYFCQCFVASISDPAFRRPFTRPPLTINRMARACKEKLRAGFSWFAARTSQVRQQSPPPEVQGGWPTITELADAPISFNPALQFTSDRCDNGAPC